MRINRKSVGRLATALLATAMLAGTMATTAFAATVGSNGIQFNVTLDMTNADGASVPSVTPTFKIEAGNPVAATNTNPEILAGTVVTATDDAGNTTVTAPSISATAFAKETTSQDVKATATVNFSGVTFTKPGIYRYKVTQLDSTDDDITEDTSVRYLDVYVENETKEDGTTGYKITNYILLDKEVTPANGQNNTVEYKDNDTLISNKVNGFANKYATSELTVSKTVAGTMGDKNKAFSFKVVINASKVDAGKTVAYSYDSSTTNGGTVILTQVGEGDTATSSATIYGLSLKDAQSIVFKGLPTDATYEVYEIIEASEGYTTTANFMLNDAVISGGANQSGTSVNTDAVANADKQSAAVEFTNGVKTADTVAVTNTKSAVTPTGIALTIAPYAAMVVLAAGAAFIFLRKRRNVED